MNKKSESRQILKTLAQTVLVGAGFLVKRRFEKERNEISEVGISPINQRSSRSSRKQVDVLYYQALIAEERGDIAEAVHFYRMVADHYDEVQYDASIASYSLAACLYQLGCLAIARGDAQVGTDWLRKAAEVFRIFSDYAEIQGAIEDAKAARIEYKAAIHMVETISRPRQPGQRGRFPDGESSIRANQEAMIRHLDQERARINEIWAQSLGRI